MSKDGKPQLSAIHTRVGIITGYVTTGFHRIGNMMNANDILMPKVMTHALTSLEVGSPVVRLMSMLILYR